MTMSVKEESLSEGDEKGHPFSGGTSCRESRVKDECVDQGDPLNVEKRTQNSNVNELEVHILEMNTDGLYKCEMCSQKFASTFILTKHIFTHADEDSFSCKVCELLFQELNKHLYYHIVDNCDDCTENGYDYAKNPCESNDRYSSERSLEECDVKPFDCEICSKRFSCKSELAEHTTTHDRTDDKKLYNCESCNECFDNENSYNEHTVIHADKQFKCEVCNKTFQSKSYIVIHMRKHTGEQPFECDMCNKKFSHKCNLRVHLKRHYNADKTLKSVIENVSDDTKQYKCETCNKRFRFKTSLTRHKRKHTGERPYKCDICEKDFNDLANMKRHLRTQHNDERKRRTIAKIKPKRNSRATLLKSNGVGKKRRESQSTKMLFKCDMCGKKLVYKDSLKRHMKIHSGERYKCPVCSIDFSDTSTMRKHLKVLHTVETRLPDYRKSEGKSSKVYNERRKLFECDICHERFRACHIFIEHVSIHTGYRPFICEICNEMFARNDDFDAHLKTHNDSVKLCKCEMCYEIFDSDADLQQHLTYHGRDGEKKTRKPRKKTNKRPLDDKPFVCEFCGKTTRTVQELMYHRRTHTGERPYRCTFCDTAFAHLSHLKRHKRLHTGERPFKCSICPKQFIQSGQLTSHMRQHTGERPYKCEMCNKGFIVGNDLKEHMLTHITEKPYSCEVCYKNFRGRESLRRHMMSSHNRVKSFKCDICMKRFYSGDSLKTHISTHPGSSISIHKF